MEPQRPHKYKVGYSRSSLVIPLLVKLIYQTILSIDIPTPTVTDSSATDRTDKASTALTIGAHVATTGGGSLDTETSPE